MSIITVTRPDGTSEQVDSCDTVVAHCVDEDGAYLGLVELQPGRLQVSGPPPRPDWRWHAGAWGREASLDEIVAEALAAIDAAAGAARARYITDVTGQSAVYLRKAEQARAWLASGLAGDPPPYIAAEAAARGLVPADLAAEIDAIAARWDDELSPAIEAIRMSGKARARASVDAAAVQASAAEACRALEAI